MGRVRKQIFYPSSLHLLGEENLYSMGSMKNLSLLGEDLGVRQRFLGIPLISNGGRRPCNAVTLSFMNFMKLQSLIYS